MPPGPGQPRFPLGSADALAFMSSSAATLGEACLACDDLAGLLRASTLIAAFSMLAVNGSMEPYAEAVHRGRRAGQQAVAARMRGLLDGQPGPPSRIQDPYGYRALPQVHGAAVDAVAHAERTVAADINAPTRTRWSTWPGRPSGTTATSTPPTWAWPWTPSARRCSRPRALAAARLGTLVEPRFTRLTPFLAGDPQPSSGIMILEYVAHAAVADIRRLAAPAALGAAVLSRGVEDHAGFSTQAARATTDVLTPYGWCWPASWSPRSARCGWPSSARPAPSWPTPWRWPPARCPRTPRTGRWTTTWPPPWTCSRSWPGLKA